ncbi:MAG: septum formation initiator family protein [Clostridia bacterium]|nr:septum formation initiator family protein [Clostridia bacterium]
MATGKKKKGTNRSKKKRLDFKKTLSTLAVLGFVFAIAILSIQWVEQERILNRQEERKQALQAQYDSIVSQIEDYNRMVQLSDSPSYIEHYLREKLGMIREDEIMYKVEIPEDQD